MTTPRHLVALAAAILAAPVGFGQDPNLSPSVLLAGSPSVNIAYGDQKGVSFAPGNGSTLVVFEDNRGGDYDIFGVRLDASGAPIDSTPFPITKDAGNQSAPKACWNGQNWLVVCTSQVPTQFGYFEYEVAARRVSPQGQVLDTAPISVTVDSTGGNFGLASDGQNWFIAATGYSAGNSDIVGRRIDNNGALLDPVGVVLQPATYYVYFGIQAVYTQGQYVIAWNDSNAVKARRYSPSLLALDHGQAATLTPSGKLASNGVELVMLWAHQTPAFLQEMVLTRYNAMLQVVGANPIPLTTAAANVSLEPAGVAWTGSQWVASWLTFGSQIAKVARVSVNGAVLDFDGVTVQENDPSVLYAPAIGALANGGACFAWHDARLQNNNVYGVSLTATLQSNPEQCFSTAGEAQKNPRIGVGPDQFLVTYRAESGSGTRVLAQRVDRQGLALDSTPIEVAAAPHAYLFTGGASWNGSVYLVAWSDTQQGKVFARRLGADGVWLDSTPLYIQNGGGADVCALGGDFLVTALRVINNYPEFVGSFGVRVHGLDGSLLDSVPLTIAGSYATRSRIVTLGGRWLVASEVHASHDENPSSVMATFVDAAGSVTPAVVVAGANIQNWGTIDVASSAAGALFVYQSGSNWINVDIFAQRMLANGSLAGSPVNITSNVASGQLRPCAVWTGDEFVVAFESYQNNPWAYDYETDVYGKRLSAQGAVLDTTPFALWNSADWETAPESASAGDGRAIFVASVYNESPYASFHAATRAMRPKGLTNYGTGTVGCAGPQAMDGTSTPKIGQVQFALTCDHGPASSLGLALVADAASVAGVDTFALGILLHVDPFASQEFFGLDMMADAAGTGLVTVGIPNNPSLVGKHYFAQGIWAWPTVCGPSPYGLSSSDGLEIVIQNP